MSTPSTRPTESSEDLRLKKESIEDSIEWFDWIAGTVSTFNPMDYLPEGAGGTIAMGSLAVGAIATLGGLFYLRRQYSKDIQARRETFQKELEKYEQAMENKRKVAQRRTLEKKDGGKTTGGSGKKGTKKPLSVTNKPGAAGAGAGGDKKKKGSTATTTSTSSTTTSTTTTQKNYAQMDVTDLFSLPMDDIINILRESAKAIEKDLANLTGLHPPQRNTSQYRRTVMRNHSISQQLNVDAEKFATLSLAFRIEAAQWLSVYIQNKYFDLTSRGLKKGEITNDNEMILYYLSFTPDQLEQLTPAQCHTVHKIILDVAQMLDDVKRITTAFDYLYTHPRLDTTGKAVIPSTVKSIDDDETGQLTYNHLTDEQKGRLSTSLDIYTIMALMPVAALLGRWNQFKVLCEDYMVYTPGPQSLDTWQRSFSALPTTPNINILYHFATTFRPVVERGEYDVSFDLDLVPPLPENPTEEELAEHERLTQEDLQRRYDAFVEQVQYALTSPPRSPDHPLVPQIQHPITDPSMLTFKEYHIRSSLADLVPERSYHHFRANLVNYRSTIAPGTKVPRLYGKGEKRILIRGAVAAIQDINAGSTNFHFGPYLPHSREYIFTSETTRIVSNSTCTQNVLVALTQSDEDIHGCSTWDGYMRVIQTPVSQTTPLFSFYFTVTLETSRVLTPEEKKRSDEALLEEKRREEEAAEAKAREAAAAADAATATAVEEEVKAKGGNDDDEAEVEGAQGDEAGTATTTTTTTTTTEGESTDATTTTTSTPTNGESEGEGTIETVTETTPAATTTTTTTETETSGDSNANESSTEVSTTTDAPAPNDAPAPTAGNVDIDADAKDTKDEDQDLETVAVTEAGHDDAQQPQQLEEPQHADDNTTQEETAQQEEPADASVDASVDAVTEEVAEEVPEPVEAPSTSTAVDAAEEVADAVDTVDVDTTQEKNDDADAVNDAVPVADGDDVVADDEKVEEAQETKEAEDVANGDDAQQQQEQPEQEQPEQEHQEPEQPDQQQEEVKDGDAPVDDVEPAGDVTEEGDNTPTPPQESNSEPVDVDGNVDVDANVADNNDNNDDKDTDASVPQDNDE